MFANPHDVNVKKHKEKSINTRISQVKLKKYGFLVFVISFKFGAAFRNHLKCKQNLWENLRRLKLWTIWNNLLVLYVLFVGSGKLILVSISNIQIKITFNKSFNCI